MKFVHISDLHIGKRLNEFSLIEDQIYILNQILEIAKTEQADGVLIAGDIYDKPVPSAEAVKVFDLFLTKLADCGIKVFAVSGNHDSPERIAFGAQLMNGRGVYVSPVYDGNTAKITLTDAYGELDIHLLPFIKPAIVRHVLEKNSEKDREENPEEKDREKLPESYHDAVAMAVQRMHIDAEKRNILIAHQFVTGAGRCDSEDISVGGIDQVDAEVFDAFDYVALGHIHSPQFVKRETVRYCGTPLKYSFSEAAQEKAVVVVECREKGRILLHTVPLTPLHDMRTIRGTYLEVTARPFYEHTDTYDYVQITLTDEEDVPDGLSKLRIIYPNLMQLVYDNTRTKQNRMLEVTASAEKKSELELFEEFYELQNNQPMSQEQAAFVRQYMEENHS